jgi:FkbM family methyltransferase
MATQSRHLRPKLTSISSFLSYYAASKHAKNQPVTCFQIGANDGKNNDPVYPFITKYNWKGVLVEPQKDVFENCLKPTYAHYKNVILENVALAPVNGSLPFYRIAFTNARWATGLSSFDRKNLEEHIKSGYVERKALADGIALPTSTADWIQTVHVPTLTTESLLEKNQIKQFDILCIDTEGFDFEILKLIPFERYSPEVVLFESKNLSNQDFKAAQDLLTKAGYELFWEKGDTLAIRIRCKEK